MTDPQWYVVRTATRQERRAFESLKELGLTVYMPCETRWVNHARRVERAQRPLFPGYLFAEIPEKDMWKALRADGVHNVVRREGRPIPLRRFWVGLVAYMEGCNEFDWTWEQPLDPWKPKIADRVKVARGRYAGYAGTIYEFRNQNRLAVLTSMMGWEKKIDVEMVDVDLDDTPTPTPKAKRTA